MARQPEVFARSLEPEEAQRLVKITRSTRDRVRLRRSGIVLASVQGRSAGEIAVMFAATEGYVREVIHAFNESGFAALSPKWRGGRPRKFGPAARDQICRIAACKPAEVGFAVHDLESGQAGRLPRRARTDHSEHRDRPADPA